MEFKDLSQRALEIRGKYEVLENKKYGRAWSRAELAQGLVVDIGDLTRLIMAKEGIREAADLDAKLKHELSDCLWSILVLARKYEIDLEKEFVASMDELGKKIEGGI